MTNEQLLIILESHEVMLRKEISILEDSLPIDLRVKSKTFLGQEHEYIKELGGLYDLANTLSCHVEVLRNSVSSHP